MSKEWTEGRLKAFIIAVLRQGTRRYPPKYECLNEAKTEKKKNTKTGRIAQHYECKDCGHDYPASMVQVDHVKPVVDPQAGFVDWNTFIERLFCEKENLQVLCKTCHDIKSKEEKQLRTSTKGEVQSKLTKQSKPRKAKLSSKGRSAPKKLPSLLKPD